MIITLDKYIYFSYPYVYGQHKLFFFFNSGFKIVNTKVRTRDLIEIQVSNIRFRSNSQRSEIVREYY